mmetsp:Transcript_23905/g.49813  ORF Transcript_23905/g.49813 Transcript_23905/m.49813 type:complete len:1062 (-) Transcript_23905:27-3212(-)
MSGELPGTLGSGDDVKLSDLPDNKLKGLRSSTQLMKDDIPATALDTHNHHPVPETIQKYANFVVKRPALCLSASVFFMLFFSAIGFIVREETPDFSEADAGFDARGTDIYGANIQWRNVVKEAFCDGSLTYFSDGEQMPKNGDFLGISYNCNQPDDDEDRRLQVDEGSSIETFEGRRLNSNRMCTYSARSEYEDMNLPFQIIFEPQSSDDIFSDVNSLIQMCNIEEEIMGIETNIWRCDTQGCQYCESRSLGNHISLYMSKGACSEITQADADSFKTDLMTCSQHFAQGQLVFQEESVQSQEDSGSLDCTDSDDARCLNPECFRDNTMFDVLNAVVPKDFPTTQKASYAKVIIMNDDWGLGKFVHKNLLEIFNSGKLYGDAKIVGYRSGGKMKIFTDQLLADNLFSGGAFIVVFFILWFHTTSGFIATFGFVQIILNLGVAYGIYMAVFYLPFFPFLNLVGIFVVVGIGADDIFVFMDSWKQSLVTLGEEATLEDRLGLVLYRACGSMFITSLTTASAFAANAFSLITSLKCFGVYCAIVVIVDFFLMLSYVPALVIIYERTLKKHAACCQCCKCCTYCAIPKDPSKLRPTETWFRDTFSPMVLKLKFPLLAVFGGFAVFMGFKSSQLPRPTTSEFQLFKSEHPMEVYDLQLKDKFWYGTTTRSMYINFVMGVEGKDNGNHWDPYDRGTLNFMPDLDISSTTAQEALVQLCSDFRDSDFYIDSCDILDKAEHNSKYCKVFHELCPMELLKKWVETPCNSTENLDINSYDCFGDTCVNALGKLPQRSTCCGLTFPIADSATFNTCVDTLSSMATDEFNRGIGFWFNSNGKISAYTTYFRTNKEYNNPYNELQTFYEGLIKIKEDFQSSTAGLGGWVDEVFFTSDLGFFDLQRSLGVGAYNSAGLSFAFAFVVLVSVTRNLIMTVLSLLTIVCIVCCVVGILVIDGWQLNIIESVIISVAVGMAVDFAAHFSHSYLHSPVKEREIAVTFMMKTMGVSVLTGAITTFIAGFFMIFAGTLFFYQFGFFMMMTMAFSWLYSNLFLAPMMAVMGPEASRGSKVKQDE